MESQTPGTGTATHSPTPWDHPLYRVAHLHGDHWVTLKPEQQHSPADHGPGIEWTDGDRNNVSRPTFPDARGRVFGAFVQPEIRFWDVVSVTPGLRFDHYYRAPDSAAIGPSLSEGRVSPRIGVQWEPAKWVSVYALYAEAFRAPSLSELYVSGVHFPGNLFIPNPNLKPETARTANAGYSYAGSRAEIAVDYFRARLLYRVAAETSSEAHSRRL